MEYHTAKEKIINKLLHYISKKSGLSYEGIRKYLANFSWQISDYIFSLLASLMVGIAVARYLGPDMYGMISFALAIFAILVIIVSLGADDVIMKDMIEHQENQGYIQGSSLFIKFIIAFISYFLVIIYAFINFHSDKFYVIFIITSSILFQPLIVFTFTFLTKAQGKYTSIARIISYFLSSILKIIFIIIKAPIIYFAFAVFLDYALLYVVVIMIFKSQKYGAKNWHIDIGYIKYILKKAVPLFATTLFYAIYQKVTIMMINSTYSDYATGVYNAAIRLTEVWFLVPAVLLTALYPAIVNAKKSSEEEYKKRIKNLLYITTLPFIIIAILTTLLSPYIIYILYGDKYIASSVVLSITIWAIPFVSFYLVCSKYFILENMISHLLFRSFLAFILVITLNYVLGGLYDLKGYSISLVISAIISFFLIDIFLKSTRWLFLIKLSAIFLPVTLLVRKLRKG